MECERILERTNEERLEAMSNGDSFDLSPRIDGEHVLELQREGINNTELLYTLVNKTPVLFTYTDISPIAHGIHSLVTPENLRIS